jgi:AraC-like DNA-binding protein
MTRPKDNSNSTPPPERFSEAAAWRDVGAGWQRLFGNFQGVGFSIEWHDFLAHREFDWASSFHPNSIELCLNLAGHGFVAGAGTRAEFTPGTAGFYFRREEPLTAGRAAGERHQFLTVEFSRPFLDRHLAETKTVLHPVVRAVLEDSASKPAASTPVRLTTAQMETIATLRQPPVAAAVQPVWYQCKALELAVTFLVQADQEFFCTRQQRLAGERVDQVRFLLSQNLAAPPSLEELGKKIGCSHFYLSRIFSAQTGQTITQYLRQLRMERAAELLKTREYNVTEVATEVGYNSLSHFSAAFQETFGCCPGLYPMATTTQKSLPKKSS